MGCSGVLSRLWSRMVRLGVAMLQGLAQQIACRAFGRLLAGLGPVGGLKS